MRWPTWLRRAPVTDRAAAAEETECCAARQRVIDVAHRDRRPGWNVPTAAYRPSTTRGRAPRGPGGQP
jgi:hypothetical protein